MPWFLPLIVGAVFAAFGLLMAFAPPERLLEIDSRSGKAVYDRTLARTGSREEALRAAGRFYRIFGLAFAALGLGLGVIQALVFAR